MPKIELRNAGNLLDRGVFPHHDGGARRLCVGRREPRELNVRGSVTLPLYFNSLFRASSDA